MSYLHRGNGYATTGNVNSEAGPVVEFTDRIDVSLTDWMGRDGDICSAARVSTKGAATHGDAPEKLIGYLMREKHGSPFEHGALKFMVTAPLFVWREHHRHRIGFSYNEESGRYRQLQPRFFIPEIAREQTGKPGHYKIAGTADTHKSALMYAELSNVAHAAYTAYEKMLAEGIAREVARMCLPVNIMSTCYVTCNPRSLMHFLSLRNAPNAQLEIQQLAGQYEAHFARLYPITHAAFLENGRVAP